MMEFIQTISNQYIFYFYQYIDRYAFLFPLGLIGVWRWSVWTLKEVVGLHYHPKTKEYKASVSLVIPVYNEDPKIFTQALVSWKYNDPFEIIAVIDYSDVNSIAIFKKFAKTFSGAILVITRIPGKRPALSEGIQKAKGDIVALVDSDTIWSTRVIRNGLSPFHDPKVAGVATYQNVLNPKTFAQRIFDVQLDLRYRHEYPFLAAGGDALVCLSGRTAFYRRDVVLPLVHALTNETFFGKPVISGDDKCLTYLVLAAGWKVAYQSNAHVYTPGMADLGSYMKQRLRWSRNSLRADIKAVVNGWPMKHPALFFFQIDKFLQAFVVVLSPLFFLVALYFNLWVTAVIIFCWWFLSRAIKIYPHLHRKPKDITLVPGFVLFSFVAGVVKMYALFSLNTQGWITRWHASRLPKIRFLQTAPAYAATAGILVLLTYGVSLYKQHMYLLPEAAQNQLVASALRQFSKLTLGKSVLGASSSAMLDFRVRKYVVSKTEDLEIIAQKFGVDKTQLFYANSEKLPNNFSAPAGTVLSIPPKDMHLSQPLHIHVFQSYPQPLLVHYDKATNTLVVNGRGQKVSLADIQKHGGQQYIKEVLPKVWLSSASIMIYKGVTLVLNKNEVEWLKLESNKNGYIALRAWDGDISITGVKITSWDSSKNDYDTDQKDGRSFVMVKDNSRMDISDSEMAYLGFATNPNLSVSPYGVSWKLSKQFLKKRIVSGDVVNTKFHHNYFGAYTFGATGMLWKGNEFFANTRYGLDPHDDSNGFLVEKNNAHDNGTHGIIFSKRCMYNTIRDNISFNNGLHGIMLHEKSNNNIIENNKITGNTSGVTLWHSSNNIIRNNTFDKNRHGVRANMQSDNNLITKNKIQRTTRYGIYLYDQANKNIISNNMFSFNEVGMYVKSNENDISNNILANNAVGIYLLDTASQNTLIHNQITQSKIYGIYTKLMSNVYNMSGYNVLAANRKDIVGDGNF